MAKSRSRLSETERAERRRQDRERLQRAAEQLLTSEGWQRWVRVRSQAGLARLSLSNQLLVALARPDATFVAGFKAWLRLGFAVNKGERAIAIVAPLPVKERDRVSGEETGETRVRPRAVASTLETPATRQDQLSDSSPWFETSHATCTTPCARPAPLATIWSS
jgi:hypothetical protein